MKLLAPRDAARAAVSARPDRPATALIHDSPDARVVVFRLDDGQQVPPHTSRSTVLLTVIAGRGTFSGADGEQRLQPGDAVAYAPEEPHGFRADGGELVVMATIAPRPGG
ncbi:MAG TPA: cupin domain-containing protein [Gemmatimonadaceae bacterium]|nr:cupin domain-containing protein [Gemmatimonadaceae bacterium]